MKKSCFLLIVFVVTMISGGYAQNTPKFDSKEEAITIVRNSEFINILRYLNDEDKSANVDRFINEVNKIVPVDSQKKEQLKTRLLFAVQGKIEDLSDFSLIHWSRGNSPYIGSGIFAVLKDNFSASEYDILSKQLPENLTIAASAYLYLSDLYKTLEGWVVGAPTDMPHYIEWVYEYFDI